MWNEWVKKDQNRHGCFDRTIEWNKTNRFDFAGEMQNLMVWNECDQ